MADDSARRPGWHTTPGRLEAFSDGVFAIAITLLVLELRAPVEADKAHFADALTKEWPTYLAYFAAFVMIGSYWLHHHLVVTQVLTVDITVLLVNLVVLLSGSLMPFPTAVVSSAWRVGTKADEQAAILTFGLVSVAMSASYIALCHVLCRRNDLLRAPASATFLAAERRRGLIAIVATAIAVVVAYAGAPTAALVLLALTPVFYLGTLPRTLAASRLPQASEEAV